MHVTAVTRDGPVKDFLIGVKIQKNDADKKPMMHVVLKNHQLIVAHRHQK
jgi:hypothetical protein